jgi:hypothetical protein
MYDSLVLWAIQPWQKPGHSLHRALDTTVLWNRCCVVTLSVVCHGRAIPLLAGLRAITLLANRGFPSAERLGWVGRSHAERDELTFCQPCEGSHRIMEETKSKVDAGYN